MFVCLFIVCLKEFHLWITSDFSPPPPLSYDDDAYDYDDDDDFDDDYDFDDDLDDYYDYDDDNDDDNDDYDEDHHWRLSTNNPPTSFESTLTCWG